MLRFVKFAETQFPKFIQWMKKEDLVETYLEDGNIVHATGGGAFRYADLAQKELGVKVIAHVCFYTVKISNKNSLIMYCFNRTNLDVLYEA